MPRAGVARRRPWIHRLGGELRLGLGLDDLGFTSGERLGHAAAGGAHELAQAAFWSFGTLRSEALSCAGPTSRRCARRGRSSARRNHAAAMAARQVDGGLDGRFGDLEGLGHDRVQ